MARPHLAIALLLSCCSAKPDAPPTAGTPPAPPAPASVAPSVSPSVAAPAPDAAPPWRTLVDLANLPEAPKAYAGAGDALLTAVLGAAHLRHCHGDATELLPVLGQGFAGSFTHANAGETAYVIRFDPCATPFSAAPRGPLLILAKGNRPVLQVPVPEDRLVAALDLDGDGRAELVLVGDAAGKTTARVVTARDGALETLFDAGPVATPCTAGAGDVESAVIEHRVTAKGLELRARRYAKACPPRP